MINLIACVTTFKNRLAIGRNGDLLFKLKDDMKFFKNITKDNLSQNSKLKKNVVLMGRKTWFSIPQKFRPLDGRINLVLTNDPQLITPIPQNLNNSSSSFYFITMDTFWKIYKKYTPNVFVIGGSNIYNYFLNRREGAEALVDRVYLTDVKTENGNNVKFDKESEPDTFMDHPDSKFKLIGYSEKYYQDNLSYRILTYKNTNVISEEHHYLDYMKHILDNGNVRDDRTGTGTISVFGNQMKFDISQSIPLMTTKRVPFKTIVSELLWMLRGDTDAKILERKGIKIWSGNTSREFLDKRGLEHYEEGILGAGYGFQYRHFGANYSQTFGDTSKIDTSLIGGVDQLKYVEDLLKNDPFSRRIMISAWNPPDFKKTALVPCHYSIQFYVTEEQNEKYLSCMFIMRSSDGLLGLPCNILGYSVLTYILAKKYNMKPKELVYISGDGHIYQNHVPMVKEQMTRVPRPFPKLKLDDSIITKQWNEITEDDFEIIGYHPYEAIKAPMAI
jgi:dihydrofolate reductase/thymidylate synthase